MLANMNLPVVTHHNNMSELQCKSFIEHSYLSHANLKLWEPKSVPTVVHGAS